MAWPINDLSVTQPITHEPLTNHAHIGFVRACASSNLPELRCFGVKITDVSRMNHAWNRARIIYNYWRITEISRTLTHCKYGAVLHEHSTHARRMHHWRSAPKHARFTNVPRTSTFAPLWTWYVRCSCVIWRWGVSGQAWTCAVSNQFRRISTDGRRVSRSKSRILDA